MNNPKIYITKEGKIGVIESIERPFIYGEKVDQYILDTYESALTKAKQEVILFKNQKDQTLIDHIIFEREKSSGPRPTYLEDCLDMIFNLPEGHSVEVEEEWWVESQQQWREVEASEFSISCCPYKVL